MSNFSVGNRVAETRYGAIQNDQWHGIAGAGKTRKLKQGRIVSLSGRFLVSGYDALIAWDDGTQTKRVADLEHLQLVVSNQAVPSSTQAIQQYRSAPRTASLGSIQVFANSRVITHLVHFTQVEKLPYIVSEGLLSNKKLRELGRPVLDEYRYDGKPDHVCVSVSFPNYQMFYRYTQGVTVDWCVLLIDVNVLWRQSCLFYPYNAAKSDLSKRPISEFQGLAAFQGMFSRIILGKERHSELPASCPTSPQAEVLVSTAIRPSDIVRIEFSSVATKRKYQPLLDSKGITSVVSRELFSPRLDWEQWKRA